MRLSERSFSVILMAMVVFIAMASGVAFAAEEYPERYQAQVGQDGIQKVSMLGGSYFFRPNYVIVKANVPVELTIKKDKTLTGHSFVLKAPEAGMDIKTKIETTPQTIKFTPTKAGKYQFYCDEKFLFFPSHKSQGMVGTLEVTE